MHINNDECIDSDDLIFSELLSHKHDSLNKLFVLLIKIAFYSLSSIGLHGCFELSSPMNLTAVKNALTRVINDPVISWSLLVVND